MSIRILLVDDHQIVRDGLRALLEAQPDMNVVAEGEDGRTAVRLVQEQAPDVVIMDIAMPALNGIEATRQILAAAPGTKVIALSMHSDRRFVAGMFNAGASGYLLKESAFEELVQAVRVVRANQTYLSPGIAGIVIDDYVQHVPATAASMFAVLTAREREVLQVLVEGRSVKQIASLLQVSGKTIETHRRKIMEKLDLHSLPALTKYALREGLISLES